MSDWTCAGCGGNVPGPAHNLCAYWIGREPYVCPDCFGRGVDPEWHLPCGRCGKAPALTPTEEQ